MKKPLVLLLAASLGLQALAQEEKPERVRDATGGQLMLGMRTTLSAFNATEGTGLGFGGQFRLRLGKKLNTEWYADYITSDIQGLGSRQDGHVGWSVQFYLGPGETAKGKLIPYLEAGHCFDYTKVSSSTSPAEYLESEPSIDYAERWSSAVHMGLGGHWMLADNFDVSLKAQYMTHLGNDVHAHVTSGNFLEVEEHTGSLSLEGHLLVTLSLNVRIADLWK